MYIVYLISPFKERVCGPLELAKSYWAILVLLGDVIA